MDLSAVRFRMDSIMVGVRLTFVVFGIGITYVAATLDEPHRSLLAGLFIAAALGALLIARLPAEHIVRSPRREELFLTWTVIQVGLIGAMVASDGGAESPLALLFFLPVVFAALSYPLLSVAAVGALAELTYVGVGAVAGDPDPVRLTFFAAALAVAAVLCAWQAHNRERQHAELTLISRADPLTGSLNRRGFEERLDAELDEGLRTGRPVAVVMIDLDHFKDVNDTRGHAAGDELLRWTVATMHQCVRPMDAVGRLGGDEFAILLPGTGHADGLEIARRVRDALAARTPVSAGVACFPAHGVDREELQRYADAELYASKDGRAAQLAPGRRELSWAAALAHAVDLRMAAPGEHASIVARYASAIGEEIGWDGANLRRLRMAAMLQDVGKVSVPDRILQKPGPLTPEEYDEIKSHPIAGSELVGRVEGLEPILPWIRHAQERFDGSGYPDGLSGEAIPLASRILHVANAFAAMTSLRPYRQAMSEEAALGELRRHAGRQFDPRCFEALEAHRVAAREPGAEAPSLG